MKTIAVANAKGGVGKSTLASHLATGFARAGKRALLIDLDSQGSTTTWLQGLSDAEGKGTAEALQAGAIGPEHLFHVEGHGRLDLLPATPALVELDHVLGAVTGGELVLRDALAEHRTRYDYCVIDCPPNMGVSVVGALCASDGVVAPLLAGDLSLAGLHRIEKTVALVNKRLGASTRVLGYVLFAADQREAVTREIRALLHAEAPGRLFDAEVRVRTTAKTFSSRKTTAWDADAEGAEDYRAVLDELLERMKSRTAIVRQLKKEAT